MIPPDTNLAGMAPEKVVWHLKPMRRRQAQGERPMIDAFKTNGSSPPAPDFDVTFHGSVVSFAPLTPAARTWVDDNVQLEPWQWLSNVTFVVDRRFAQPLIEGILSAGLEFSEEFFTQETPQGRSWAFIGGVRPSRRHEE